MQSVIPEAYRRARRSPVWRRPHHNGSVEHDRAVLAGVRPLCNRVSVDQERADQNFTASTAVEAGRVVVTIGGEVDMSTADAMFEAATRDATAATTLDLRSVTFFDSAAIHALLRLAERYGDGLTVLPSAQVRRVLEISGLSTQPWLKG